MGIARIAILEVIAKRWPPAEALARSQAQTIREKRPKDWRRCWVASGWLSSLCTANRSDAGEGNDSDRDCGGYVIEERVLWVDGGGKQEILGWE